MIAVTAFFRNSNYAEAALWVVMGVLIAVLGARWRLPPRTRIVLLVTLLAFGGSDVVEAHTGAWWDPWWLLVWKGVCVAILLIVIVQTIRARRLNGSAVESRSSAIEPSTSTATEIKKARAIDLGE